MVHPNFSADDRAWLSSLLTAHVGDCVAMRGIAAGLREGRSTRPLSREVRAWVDSLLAFQDGSCRQTHLLVDALRAAVEG